MAGADGDAVARRVGVGVPEPGDGVRAPESVPLRRGVSETDGVALCEAVTGRVGDGAGEQVGLQEREREVERPRVTDRVRAGVWEAVAVAVPDGLTAHVRVGVPVTEMLAGVAVGVAEMEREIDPVTVGANVREAVTVRDRVGCRVKDGEGLHDPERVEAVVVALGVPLGLRVPLPDHVRVGTGDPEWEGECECVARAAPVAVAVGVGLRDRDVGLRERLPGLWVTVGLVWLWLGLRGDAVSVGECGERVVLCVRVGEGVRLLEQVPVAEGVALREGDAVAMGVQLPLPLAVKVAVGRGDAVRVADAERLCEPVQDSGTEREAERLLEAETRRAGLTVAVGDGLRDGTCV